MTAAKSSRMNEAQKRALEDAQGNQISKIKIN